MAGPVDPAGPNGGSTLSGDPALRDFLERIDMADFEVPIVKLTKMKTLRKLIKFIGQPEELIGLVNEYGMTKFQLRELFHCLQEEAAAASDVSLGSWSVTCQSGAADLQGGFEEEDIGKKQPEHLEGAAGKWATCRGQASSAGDLSGIDEAWSDIGGAPGAALQAGVPDGPSVEPRGIAELDSPGALTDGPASGACPAGPYMPSRSGMELGGIGCTRGQPSEGAPFSARGKAAAAWAPAPRSEETLLTACRSLPETWEALQQLLPAEQLELLAGVREHLQRGEVDENEERVISKLLEDALAIEVAAPHVREFCRHFQGSHPFLKGLSSADKVSFWLDELAGAKGRYQQELRSEKFKGLAASNPLLAHEVWQRLPSCHSWLKLPEICNYTQWFCGAGANSEQLFRVYQKLERAKDAAAGDASQATASKVHINDVLIKELRALSGPMHLAWVRRNRDIHGLTWIREPADARRAVTVQGVLERRRFSRQEQDALFDALALTAEQLQGLTWESFQEENLNPRAVHELQSQKVMEPLNEVETMELLRKLDDLMELEPVSSGPPPPRQLLHWSLKEFAIDFGIDISALSSVFGLGPEMGMHLAYQVYTSSCDGDPAQTTCSIAAMRALSDLAASALLVMPLLSLLRTIIKDFDANFYYQDVMRKVAELARVRGSAFRSLDHLRAWCGSELLHDEVHVSRGLRCFLQLVCNADWGQVYAEFDPRSPTSPEEGGRGFKCVHFVGDFQEAGHIISFVTTPFRCTPLRAHQPPTGDKQRHYVRACEQHCKQHGIFTLEVAQKVFAMEHLQPDAPALIPIAALRSTFISELQACASDVEAASPAPTEVWLHHEQDIFKCSRHFDNRFHHDKLTSTHAVQYISVPGPDANVPQAIRLMSEAPRVDLSASACWSECDGHPPCPVEYGDRLPALHIKLARHKKKFRVRASAAGCCLHGDEGIGKDGEAVLHLTICHHDINPQLLLNTAIVVDVLDGPHKGVQMALPPLRVQGVRLSKQTDKDGRPLSCITHLDDVLWVQRGVPFRLALDMLVPGSSPWTLCAHDERGIVRPLECATTSRTYPFDLVCPEREGQPPFEDTVIHINVTAGDSGSSNLLLKLPNVKVHRSAKVRSNSWLWTPWQESPRDDLGQLLDVEVDTISTFPMLTRQGTDVTMHLVSSRGQDPAVVQLEVWGRPLPEAKVCIWLGDGRARPLSEKERGPADPLARPGWTAAIFETRISEAEAADFRVQLDLSTDVAQVPKEAFMDGFLDYHEKVLKMKPKECLTALGELFLSQEARERDAGKALSVACTIAKDFGLDLRALRRADVQTLCPLDLWACLNALQWTCTSPNARENPLLQVVDVLRNLDEILNPVWDLPSRRPVDLALYHLQNGVKAPDILAKMLSSAPGDRLDEDSARAEKEVEDELRTTTMRFYNKFHSPQGYKEVASCFRCAEEHEGCGEDYDVFSNPDAYKLCADILKEAERHGSSLPRALRLRRFEDLRLSFPDLAEEKVFNMAHEEVVEWCREFAEVWDDDTEQGERRDVDYLLTCIRRLKNEPSWPPMWPFHKVLKAPKPRIRVTGMNGAYFRTLAVTNLKTRMHITEAGIIQQNYSLEPGPSEHPDCGFELKKNPAGKPLEAWFRDLKEAPQPEISLELEDHSVPVKWREEPPQVGDVSDAEDIFLPAHAIDVTVVESARSGTVRRTFKRFLLRVRGTTSCPRLDSFLRLLGERATLKHKYKGGWFETAEQLRDVMNYILSPPRIGESSSLIYNFSPSMLGCMTRAGVPQARRHCRDALELYTSATDNDEVKRELAQLLIPEDDGSRVRTLIFEPSRWCEVRPYVEAIQAMGIVVEAWSLDQTSLDTFLQWLHCQQEVTTPSFVLVRSTDMLSLSDLARVHQTSANNEALTILWQAGHRVMHAFNAIGVRRDPVVKFVGSQKGPPSDTFSLLPHEGANGEPLSDVGSCIQSVLGVMDTPHRCHGAARDPAWDLVECLQEQYESIREKLIAAHQVYPFKETWPFRLIHGDVDAARDVISEFQTESMQVIDVAADLDLNHRISKITVTDKVNMVFVVHSHFLSEVQKRSLLEDLNKAKAKPNGDAAVIGESVCIVFLAPRLLPVDFELGVEPVVQWAAKPVPDRKKRLSRLLGALQLVMPPEVLVEVGTYLQNEHSSLLSKEQLRSTCTAMIMRALETLVPAVLLELASGPVSAFLKVALEEASATEELDEPTLPGYKVGPANAHEALQRIAKFAVAIQRSKETPVPFSTFREQHFAGALLPPRVLIEGWASSTFAGLLAPQVDAPPQSYTWTPPVLSQVRSNHLLLHFVTGDESTSIPSFWVAQKDPFATDRDAFMEQLLRGEDVDYNAIRDVPQFPWGHHAFTQMVCCASPHMIPLLMLSVPENQLLPILWNAAQQQERSRSAHRAFGRLRAMVCDPVLCLLKDASLARRLAVVRWCLVRASNGGPKVEFRDADLIALLEMRENVPGFQEMGSEIPSLVPLILACDRPRGVVCQQMGLRACLEGDHIAVDSMMEARDQKLGALWLEIVFDSAAKPGSQCKLCRHPFAAFWRRFVDSPATLDLGGSALHGMLRRMTPAAFCEVAERCTHKSQLETLVELLRANGAIDTRTLLQDLATRTFTLRFCLLDLLFNKMRESMTVATEMSGVEPATPFSTMLHILRDGDLTPWVEHAGEFGPLPLGESEELMRLLTTKYGGMWSADDTPRFVQELTRLVSDTDFNKLFSVLRKSSLRFLAWAKDPTEVISMDVDSKDDLVHLHVIASRPCVGFAATVQQTSGFVAPEALLFCHMPLSHDDFLRFARLLEAPLHDLRQVQTSFVIRQDARYAAYLVRVQPCPLSHDEFEEADRFVKGASHTILASLAANTSPTHVANNFNVQSGYSLQLLHRNLQALLHSPSADYAPYDTPFTVRLIQKVVWAWFWSLLPATKDVKQIVLGEWLRKDAKDFAQWWPEEVQTPGEVAIPLPSTICTARRMSEPLRLFAARRENAAFTLQTFQQLLNPFSDKDVRESVADTFTTSDFVSPSVYDLLHAANTLDPDILEATPTYQDMHTSFVEDVYGPGLIALLTSPRLCWKSPSSIELLRTVLEPFVNILKMMWAAGEERQPAEEADELALRAEQMLTSLIGLVKARVVPDQQEPSCITCLHRVFHMLLGVSNDVVALQSKLVAAFCDAGLSSWLCWADVCELNWFAPACADAQARARLQEQCPPLLAGAKRFECGCGELQDLEMHDLVEFSGAANQALANIGRHLECTLPCIPAVARECCGPAPEAVCLVPRYLAHAGPFRASALSKKGPADELAVSREPLQELVEKIRDEPTFIDCMDFLEVRLTWFSCAVVVPPASFVRLRKCSKCKSQVVSGSKSTVPPEQWQAQAQSSQHALSGGAPGSAAPLDDTASCCRVCSGHDLRVQLDFPTSGHAWDYLSRQPEETTLLARGLTLIRRGNGWSHYIDSQKLAAREEPQLQKTMAADAWQAALEGDPDADWLQKVVVLLMSDSQAKRWDVDMLSGGLDCDIGCPRKLPRCLSSGSTREWVLASAERCDQEVSLSFKPGDDRQYFFTQLLDTQHLLHLQHLDSATGRMFGQVLFPLAQLLRNTVLTKILSGQDSQHAGTAASIRQVSRPALLDWFRAFEELANGHAYVELLRTEHRALTQAVIEVAAGCDYRTKAAELRVKLGEAHSAFSDAEMCDALQANKGFFEALLGFVTDSDIVGKILKDTEPKHPAQSFSNDSWRILEYLGGRCVNLPAQQEVEGRIRTSTDDAPGSEGRGTGRRGGVAPRGSAGAPLPSVPGAAGSFQIADHERVQTLFGPPVDHLICQCPDTMRRRGRSAAAQGLSVSYIVPVGLLSQVGGAGGLGATREGLEWVVDVLRAPMGDPYKSIMLYRLADSSHAAHGLGSSVTFKSIKDEFMQDARGHVARVRRESPEDKWVAKGLEQACPFPDIQEYLAAWIHTTLDVSDEESKFVERQRKRYGVQFVPLSVNFDGYRGMRPIRARVDKLYIRKHFKAACGKPSAIFKLIEASFTDNCHFVAVYDLETIDDELLKWLCEFTHDNPWNTVFLMGTDPALKLPENLDRCKIHDRSSKSKAHTVEIPLERPSVQALHGSAAIHRRTEWRWQSRALEHVRSDERKLPMLLVGGPGIGKTHTAGSEIHHWCCQNDYDYKRLDGSSPTLIDSSLWDVLERTFTKAHAENIVFVIDEWHMMIEERKRQAIQFFLSEPRVIPILLSNRYDSSDQELLKSAYGDKGFVDRRHIVLCSLNCEQYIKVMLEGEHLKAADKTSHARVAVFLEQLRMLFGDEVIGFSMRDRLKALCEVWDSKQKACKLIEEIIERRVPYLNKEWSSQILYPHLYDWLVQVVSSEQPQPTAASRGTLNFLFGTANHARTPELPNHATDLLDYLLPTVTWRQSEEMVSYIEYVRDHVKNSFNHHPHHLMFSYFIYRCGHVGLHVDDAYRARALQVFRSRSVVGLPMLFPRLLMEKAQESKYTTVVYQEVDPGDLRAVLATLKRGMSPDWGACERQWKAEGITDVTNFVPIVSVWSGVLAYVGKQNLFDLLEGSGSEGAALARGILQEMPPQEKSHQEQMNLFYMACWWCYRSQGGALVVQDGQFGKRFTTTSDGQFAIHGTAIQVDLLKLLCWASNFCGHHTRVFQMDVPDFEACLRHDLLSVSSQPGAPLFDLWGHTFAYLLTVGEEGGGLPWSCVEEMASAHFPPPQKWPAEAQALAELHAKRLHPSKAQVLAVDSFFRFLVSMQEWSPSRVDLYVKNLVQSVCEARLPVAMQLKLLKSGLPVPDEVAQRPLVVTFLRGLEELKKHGAHVELPACKFRDLLRQVAVENDLAVAVPHLGRALGHQ